jgi:hypothetical protein
MGFGLAIRSLFTLPSVFRSIHSSATRQPEHRQRLGLLLIGMLLPGALALPPLHAQKAVVGAMSVGGGFSYPVDLAFDANGNLYVADAAIDAGGNNTSDAVYEVPSGCLSSSCVTSLPGSFDPLTGLALDSNVDIYVAGRLEGETGNYWVIPAGCTTVNCVRAVFDGGTTPLRMALDGAGDLYASVGLEGYVYEVPAGCANITCTFGLPAPNVPNDGVYAEGVALDQSGNVYVAYNGNGDGSITPGSVWKIPVGCSSSSCLVSLGGGFGSPTGIAVDKNNNVYVADSYYSAVDEIPPGCTSSNCVITLATFQPQSLGSPLGVAVDGNGHVFVADNAHAAVVELTAQNLNFGNVAVGSSSASTQLSFYFTEGGTGVTTSVLTQGTKGLDFSNAGTGTCDTNGSSYTYNAGDSCTVNVTFSPMYAGTRYGAVELLGSGNVIATAYIYGTGQGPQLVFGPPATPTALGGGFDEPIDLAVDASGNVYVADSGNRAVKKMPAGCNSSTCVATLGGGFNGPFGVAVDGAGNVYVADGSNSQVDEMPPGCSSSSCVTTLGGGFNALLPSVAVDGSGNVYVIQLDTVYEMPPGCTSSSCVAPVGGGFSQPSGVAVDGNGNIYIADTGNKAVKEMPPGCASATCVSTLGGGFNAPEGLAVNGTGSVYVSDIGFGYGAVKEMPAGCASSSCVSTLGSGFNQPWGVAVDGSGNVYFAENAGSAVLELPLATPPSLTFASTAVGNQSSDSPQTVVLRNIGNQTLSFPVPGSGENPSVSANFTLDSSTTCPEVLSSSSAGTLAAGTSCVLAVDFIPTTSGPIIGSAVLTDNNLNAIPAVTQSIGLSGTGVAAALITPTVTMTPGQSSINSAQSLSVGVAVSGGSGNPIPTGSVTLSGGGYTSAATTLTAGSATINIPAGQLAVGSDTLTATYTPDSGSSSTYNGATGTAQVTVVQAIGSCSTANPNPNPNPESFAAVGDFNGDCKSDILWRNTSTEQVYEWLMNGTTYSGSGSPGSPTSDWVIQGVGDFNGDGYADILWRNSTTGEVYIWLMNGTTFTSSGSLGYVSSDWTIQGVGDFNGDGKADILWRNTTTGQVYLWLINGTTMSGGGSVTYITSDWVIQSIGDFNGDGDADILWRNTTTGEVYIWLMNSNTLTTSGSLGYVSSDWSIQGVGDFDGDGKSDILWRNSTTGQVYLWLINGTTMSGGGSVTYVSSDWVIQGLGDYDGSGRAGILWRNSTTEQVYVWLMDGTTLTSSGSPGAPDATWQIAP